MVEQTRENISFDLMFKQLEMCWADKRNYETMVWQTPTISIGIIAVLLGGLLAARPFSSTSLGSNALMLIVTLLALAFAFGIGLVGYVQLEKHWFFCMARTHDIDLITKNLSMYSHAYWHPVQFHTPDILSDRMRPYYNDVPRHWVHTQRAHHWLEGLMIAVLLFLGVAIIFVGGYLILTAMS